MRLTTDVYVVKVTLKNGKERYLYFHDDGSIGLRNNWFFATKWLNEYSARQDFDDMVSDLAVLIPAETYVIEQHTGPRID